MLVCKGDDRVHSADEQILCSLELVCHFPAATWMRINWNLHRPFAKCTDLQVKWIDLLVKRTDLLVKRTDLLVKYTDFLVK